MGWYRPSTVIMTHIEPFMLHEPKWAILCYHELCPTVCPLWKWNLPSIGFSHSRTHCLLVSKCLVCQSSTPGIGIHLRQTSFPCKPTPKISIVYPVIPQNVFPTWNSKNVKIISAKESGDYLLKKLLKMGEERSHSLKECKTRSSNKRPNSLFEYESISFLFPG